ncbi:hypothetical protein MRX96_002433 [Rhipicephalus microplus]
MPEGAATGASTIHQRVRRLRRRAHLSLDLLDPTRSPLSRRLLCGVQAAESKVSLNLGRAATNACVHERSSLQARP